MRIKIGGKAVWVKDGVVTYHDGDETVTCTIPATSSTPEFGVSTARKYGQKRTKCILSGVDLPLKHRSGYGDTTEAAIEAAIGAYLRKTAGGSPV